MEVITKSWGMTGEKPIMEKLQHVKQELKKWNKVEFGNIENSISSLETEIQKWDSLSNTRDLTDNELKERYLAQFQLWAWLKKSEVYWA